MIRRSTRLKPGKPPARKPMKRKGRSKADARREFARVYGSEERVEWTRNSPSVASGKGPCVNAHVTPDVGLPSGTGRKADHRWIVPLTDEEHREHHAGQATFEARYGITLPGKAREHHAKWLAHVEARKTLGRPVFNPFCEVRKCY